MTEANETCVLCGQTDPDDTATLSDGTARRVHGRCLPEQWRARLEIVPSVQSGVPCLPMSRLPADQFGGYASEPDGGAWVLTDQGWPYLTQAHLDVCRWYVGAYRKRVMRRWAKRSQADDAYRQRRREP